MVVCCKHRTEHKATLQLLLSGAKRQVCHTPLLHCISAAKKRGELISEMAAARLIYGRHWKGATGTQRGRRMLHLETNCRSIEPTQPKSPAGEMESDQLPGSYGCSRLTFGTARRSRAGQTEVPCTAGKEQGMRLLAQLDTLWCRVWHCAVHGQPYGRRQKYSKLTLRLLMSYIYIYIYIYGAPILDVSRSHTTTHHSR